MLSISKQNHLHPAAAQGLGQQVCIPQTRQIPGCQSCPLVPSVNTHDNFGGDLGVIQELIFPLRLRGPFIDSKAKGRLSGKIIGPGIGMELSCNRRLLERILSDFLSQWIADFFFFFF